MDTKKEKVLYFLGFAIAFIIAIIYIFTNVGYDSEYQIAMGYRLVQGDRMLVNMWEPHQTSAFLVAVFEWLFLKISGATTGIVLFLQIISSIIRGLIALLLYKSLKTDCGKNISFVIALLFFVVMPKDIALAEFSNMQLWFGVLLFICLKQYYDTQKNIWVIFGAVSLCLQILSYPSCIVVTIPAVVFLTLLGKKKKNSVILFLTVCTVIGTFYAGYFLINVGFVDIQKILSLALSVEPTHTISPVLKLKNYIIDFSKLFAILLITIIPSLGIEIVIKSLKKGKAVSIDRIVFITFLLLSLFYLYTVFSAKNRHNVSVVYVFVLMLGLINFSVLNKREKTIYYMGMSIGLFSFLATLILADNPGRTSIPYGLLAICISFLPIIGYVQNIKSLKTKKAYLICLISFFALIFIRTVYIRIPISGRDQITAITERFSIIRNGPAMGIITDYEGTCRQRDSFNEWNEFVSEGDNIIIIGGDVVDTLGYLYMDTTVATPSVMSTPTYSDSLLEYWNEHPEKYPDVVIVASYGGEIDWSVRANEWVWKWLENGYNPSEIKDGTWWTYYYK